MTQTLSQLAPSEEDILLATASGSRLARLLASGTRLRVQTSAEDEPIDLPIGVSGLLMKMLTEMAQGNTVVMVPVHTELTTHQAADLLGVSRPYLIGLLERGEIQHRKVGKHRRIRTSDLLAFLEQAKVKQLQALQELADEAQELNMGY